MATSSSFFSNSYYQLPKAQPRWVAVLQAWLPVALFATIFAIESTASLGTDHTSAPLHSAWHFFFGGDPAEGWSYTHHIIRKIGHFSGYGALSLICFRGFWLTLYSLPNPLVRRLDSHGLAIAATFCVASADEIHQTFLPNRTGLFSDVLLDTGGAAAIQLVLFLLLTGFAFLRRHDVRQQEQHSWDVPLMNDPWSHLEWSAVPQRSFKVSLKSLRPKRTRIARVRRLSLPFRA